MSDKLKTEQLIERKLIADIKALQSTRSQFLDLASLDKACGYLNINRDTKKYFDEEEDLEAIYQLLSQREIITQSYADFFQELKSNEKGLLGYLEDKGLVKKRTGKLQGRWIDPDLWVFIAVWLHGSLKATVTIWLRDGLIEERHAGGVSFKELNSLLDKRCPQIKEKHDPRHYIEVATEVNKKVFGKFVAGNPWNQATKEQLAQRKEILISIINAINADLITDLEQVLLLIKNARL